MKTCNNCGQPNKDVIMSEWAYEAHEARHERQMRRMWIVVIILIAAILLNNFAWIAYESQFETYSYDQDGNGINNVNNGEQGDIVNEPTVESESQEEIGNEAEGH